MHKNNAALQKMQELLCTNAFKERMFEYTLKRLRLMLLDKIDQIFSIQPAYKINGTVNNTKM